MSAVSADVLDIPFIQALIKANMLPYYEANGCTWDDSSVERSLRCTDNYMLLHKETRVGVLCIREDPDALCITDLQILPEHRNRGIGTFALNFAERLALELGLPFLRLSVFYNNRAIALYKRRGFRELECKENTLILQKIVTLHAP